MLVNKCVVWQAGKTVGNCSGNELTASRQREPRESERERTSAMERSGEIWCRGVVKGRTKEIFADRKWCLQYTYSQILDKAL